MDYSLSVIASGSELCIVVYETVVRNNLEEVCEYRAPGHRECPILSFPIAIHVNMTFVH